MDLRRGAVRLARLSPANGDGRGVVVGARRVRHEVDEGEAREVVVLVHGVAGREDVALVLVKVDDPRIVGGPERL